MKKRWSGSTASPSSRATTCRATTLVLHAVDPELTIPGSSVSNAFAYFESAMHCQLQIFAFPKTLEGLQIVCSTLPNVAVFGPASLCLTGCKSHTV